ncbi:SsrA-binding protein [Friedmanniella endophytica]|uniref:SsrA-binding protein n=1 Tax=Microlunatus kandeliicorticis TaxID=1759536 RepID=A0A7W3IV00_9ACTN|nr:SsrA-binding protein SmpB [Microlunatus kandeliicorticis]MBA8795752.1 SsrA-binding protein [Microlunatus kandeliicorticis]
MSKAGYVIQNGKQKPKTKPEKGVRTTVAQNRRARHDYAIGDVYEAGIVLTGTEVKSLREGRASLADAFATVDDGEVWLRQAHIPEYSHGTWTNHTARRTRKLLLNRREIARLERELTSTGTTLVPLSLYFVDGYAKVELGVGTGKREYDKRQSIASRDARREAERALAARNRGER